jgi:hypothetical protein
MFIEMEQQRKSSSSGAALFPSIPRSSHLLRVIRNNPTIFPRQNTIFLLFNVIRG